MPESKVKFVVKNFRAVANAEIALDGISVLTGENGCGKSSISKLVYYSLFHSKKYENVVNEIVDELTKRISFSLSDLCVELDIQEPNDYRHLSVVGKGTVDFLLDKLSNHSDEKLYTERTKGILYETILLEIIKIETYTRQVLHLTAEQYNLDKIKSKSISEIFVFLKEISNKVNDNINRILTKKPKSLLFLKLESIFKQAVNQENCEIIEFEGKLINNHQNRIYSLQSIDAISYIDTPMSVGKRSYPYEKNSEKEHWSYLNETLRNHSNNCLSISNLNTNKQDILNGTVEYYYNSDINDLSYKRKDGKILNLLNCATGLKSFAILQLLYQQNFLNDKTLLIIDEPEAHLHPQWIVEYARLIVLLNKELGVKFLIASHHPQMISSIKYIAEKEEVDDKINFYLGEKATEFTYNFKNYGTDIEPIFASFNIAFDKMDQYAATE